LEEGVFGFFLLFLGQGWGVAVRFNFFLVWGGGGLKFGYIIYRCSFGFKVLGFAGGCFWILKKIILGKGERGEG
jgi:hypothetical protein